jgi:hypothetical protein
MRCLACDAEMILMKVVKDDTMAVPGFEHHSFMCSACHDVERRLVFTRRGRESDTEPMPAHTAPPIAPASAAQDERIAAPGLFSRVVAKILGDDSGYLKFAWLGVPEAIPHVNLLSRTSSPDWVSSSGHTRSPQRCGPIHTNNLQH